MTTLVTGATGFLCRHLLALLLERDEQVRALVRRTSDAEELGRLGIAVVVGDVLDPAAARAASAGCERVFHLAGRVSHRRRDLPQLQAINVDGVRSVLAAVEPSARVVHVSSVAALGPAPSPALPAGEEQAFPDVAARYPYAATKRAGEQLALAAAASGTDVVVANPWFLLGPGDVHGVSTWHVREYLRGTLHFTTPGGLSNVDARDVAAGLVAVAERGRTGERYILTSREGNLGHAAFFRRLALVTGVHRRMVRLPRTLAVLAGTLVPRPVAPDEIRAASHWWFYDPAKAERELGFATRPLDETLADTAADYR